MFLLPLPVLQQQPLQSGQPRPADLQGVALLQGQQQIQLMALHGYLSLLRSILSGDPDPGLQRALGKWRPLLPAHF